MLMQQGHPGSAAVGLPEAIGRRSLLAAALFAATPLSGCGGLAIFSSGRAKIPDLPSVQGGGSIRQAWDASFAGAPGFQPARAGGKAWVASPVRWSVVSEPMDKSAWSPRAMAF
jgi:hypothetical protein